MPDQYGNATDDDRQEILGYVQVARQIADELLQRARGAVAVTTSDLMHAGNDLRRTAGKMVASKVKSINRSAAKLSDSTGVPIPARPTASVAAVPTVPVGIGGSGSGTTVCAYGEPCTTLGGGGGGTGGTNPPPPPCVPQQPDCQPCSIRIVYQCPGNGTPGWVCSPVPYPQAGYTPLPPGAVFVANDPVGGPDCSGQGGGGGGGGGGTGGGGGGGTGGGGSCDSVMIYECQGPTGGAGSPGAFVQCPNYVYFSQSQGPPALEANCKQLIIFSPGMTESALVNWYLANFPDCPASSYPLWPPPADACAGQGGGGGGGGGNTGGGGTGGECCPPQQIIVPAPVVNLDPVFNITIDGTSCNVTQTQTQTERQQQQQLQTQTVKVESERRRRKPKPQQRSDEQPVHWDKPAAYFFGDNAAAYRDEMWDFLGLTHIEDITTLSQLQEYVWEVALASASGPPPVDEIGVEIE